MDNNIRESIIKTLAYYDIFDYPLTLSELRKFSNLKYKMSDSKLMDEVDSIPIIQQSNSFYYFLGRSEIIAKRLERAELSAQKFGKARLISNFISKIPTVEFVGVTGSLAINNSSSSDNIDLILLTRKNTLWLTKMAVDVMLGLMKQRPSRNNKKNDRINTVIFFDRSEFAVPKAKNNLSFAHEIGQIRTLFQKNNSQNDFLNSNKWIANFLPNILLPSFKKKKSKKQLVDKLLNNINLLIYRFIGKKSKNLVFSSKNYLFTGSMEKEKIVLDLYEIKSQKYIKLYEEDMWIETEDAKYYLDEKKVRILN